MKIIYPTITSVQYIETVRQYKEQAGQVYDARYHQCKTKSNILKNISFVSIFICCIVSLLNLRWHLFPALPYSFIIIGCSVIATMLVIWNPWEEPEYEYTRKEQKQLEDFEKDCIGVADQQKYQRTVHLLQKLEQLKEEHVVSLCYRVTVNDCKLLFQPTDRETVSVELPFSYKELITLDGLDFSVLDQKIK